jgi:hypothetical protein
MTQAFNLSQLGNRVNTSGQLDASTGLFNQAPVANGGTGRSTLTANNVLLGNGTSAVNFVAPGTNGNVLTSNGTTWQSTAISVVPIIQTQTLTGSGSWSKPTTGNYQWVKIEIWAGGGSGGRSPSVYPGGGGGGGAYNTITVPLSFLASSENYTAAAGGAARSTNGVGNIGGNASFSITNYPVKSATLLAFGGGGGGGTTTTGSQSGGGGGGITSAGTSSSGGTGSSIGIGGNPNIGTEDQVFGGTDGAASGVPAKSTIYGGGGGGGATSSATGGTPGNSVYGGGGGGSTSGSAGIAGGTSIFGGNGSAGVPNAGTASAGQTPAGGGGGSEAGTSGAGGNGQIVLTWW